MIFTEETMKENPLFANLMQDINSLYAHYGEPEFPTGPTTDNRGYDSTYGRAFTSDSIGDWDGHENEIAQSALDQLETVLDGIDRGRHPYYYPGSENFEEFQKEALGLINEDISHNAFDRMCGNPWMVGYELEHDD